MPIAAALAAAVAVSAVGRVAAADGPRGEHLAFGTTPGTLTVAWHTTTAAGTPVVRWAPVGRAVAAVTAEGVSASYLIAPNASAYVHRVVIGPIPPGRYTYRAGHAGGAEGTPFPFEVPRPGATARLIFFGDSGNSHQWADGTVPAVASEVAAGAVSAVVHTGDMAYYSKDDGGQMGGIHAEQLSNATGHSVPLMTVVGNGDVFCYRPPGIPAWAACTEDYQRRYIMPRWDQSHSLWSSFSVGLVHVILLDSEAKTWCQATQNHSVQRAFMEADLAGVDRHAHPWLLAVVHRPLYTSCLNGGEQQAMRDGFADLFERYRVDVVLNGHVHSYERTWPVRGDYNESTNATVDRSGTLAVYRDPQYPVHVVAGTAGNGESIDDCSEQADAHRWSFSAVRSNDIGYGRLAAPNATHLELEFFSVTQHATIDRFAIERAR